MNRVLGHGIDLVEVQRVAASVEQFGERFLRRVFTSEEQAYCHGQAEAGPHWAARWAAKEAVAKAFGTGIGAELGWLDIEVVREAGGMPAIRLHGVGADLALRRGVEEVRVSLSHTREMAMASILLLGRG